MENAGHILLEERPADRVAVLRLNRPDRLNAVSLPLYESLKASLHALADDASVRVVVVTGAGRAFCVGADLKAHGEGELTDAEREAYVRGGQAFYAQLQTFPKPVVAAVNGHAIGAGLELALSCDLIVVAQRAKLRLPEIGLGTFVGGGTVFTLAQRVGVGRAKELIMLGDFFSGDEAAAMGVANAAVPTEDVESHALEWAATLAEKAPVSMRLAKDLLYRAQRLDYTTAMQLEGDALLACMATEDWKEGVQAFHDGRDPNFRGV